MITFISLIRSILTKFWKEIVITLLFIIAVYFVYSKGYDIAYQERTAHYEAILKENREVLVTKLDSIEKLALDEQSIIGANHTKLIRDLSVITRDLKSKKLYIIKNGECVPSDDFLNSFNSIIIRGNKR